METLLVSPEGKQWTDTPRDLTEVEITRLIKAIRSGERDGQQSPRLVGIKVYREMTDATLGSAVRFVDTFVVQYGLAKS